MGVIGKTKRQAFERSIDGILEAVRIDYSSDGFVSPREYFYEGNNLILLTVNNETLDESVGIKGKINGKGFIYVDGEGTIHVENVCSKDYCANGTEPNVVITENATGEIPELSKNDPMIKIKGDKTVYVNIGDTYTELGAIAKTKSGQVLEYTTEITLNGEVVTNIDTTNENTYVITYKTEYEGKTVTDTRNVVILDMKPAISITEGNIKYVKEQEILITTSAVRPNTITSFTVEIKKDGEVIKTETVNGISKTIMLNETGNYEVIITVTDNNEHTSTITKTYKIDSEPPVIEFTKEITLKANQVSGFVFENDETVKVSDNSNTVTLKIEGNLNSTIGDQTITYIAIDEAGNETRKTRVFHIEKADGPVLNSDSASSNGIWIKATTIKLSAEIQTENDELTEFTYQVDDGEIVNVPITNNKQMEASVDLNTTGRHTIKVTATGKHGNTTTLSLGEFLIDAVIPTLTVNNYSGKYGDSKVLSTLYTATFGEMGGNVVCKNGSTEITNVNEIKLAGTYSIKCTATGKNGKSTEKAITITLTSRTFTEIMSGTGRFHEEAKTFEEVMRPLLGSSVSNNDPDHNLRYVGSNPSNYVSFNNGELWRIIGLFNGQAKLVKATSIIEKAWDDDPSHGEYGWNDWNESTLQKYLNGEYLENGMDEISKRYIDTSHIWNLGGWNTSNITRDLFYEKERGTTVYTGRPTEWTGSIGLLYASDYGYSTNGGSVCGSSSLSRWNETDIYEECAQNSWLFDSSIYQWLLNPTILESGVLAIRNVGRVVDYNALSTSIYGYSVGTKPTLYLKTNIRIKSGTGTEDDPYILTEADVDTKDPNKNLRYVGSNPNNYVKFNNELWRIIGLFGNNPKIIKNEPYKTIAWDSNNSSNWENATLQKELNGTYLTNNIDNTSKTYVETYTWKLGGTNTANITREQFYNSERGTDVYSTNPTQVNKPIGLMHASDYGYSSSGGSMCDTLVLHSWNINNECGANSWIVNTNIEYQWTLSNYNTRIGIHTLHANGYITYDHAPNNLYVARPVLYLKTNVKVHGGTGSSTDPYIIGT